jgi:effector-binding domain-containing protein
MRGNQNSLAFDWLHFTRDFPQSIAKPFAFDVRRHKVHAYQSKGRKPLEIFQSLEQIMKTKYQPDSIQSTGVVATLFGIAITVLMVGGYEVTQSAETPVVASAQADTQAVVKLEPIVVIAKRG